MLLSSTDCTFKSLTLSRRRPLSYRNQSTDLLRKSMGWFLYDNGLRLERVKHVRDMTQGVLQKKHYTTASGLNKESLMINSVIYETPEIY